jgi:hypothetical protein
MNMRIKSPLLLLAAFLYASLLFTGTFAHAQIQAAKTSVRIGESTVLEGPDIAGATYRWVFEAGSSTNARQRIVTWTAPLAISDNPSKYTATLEVTAAGGTDTYTIATAVFTSLYIVNQSNIGHILISGESQTMEVEGGDYSQYLWTVTGPEGPIPSMDHSGDTFTFTAPSTGLYAGAYTVTVSDSIGGSGGTDTHVFHVPPAITGDHVSMLEGGAPVTFSITGAPVGAIYTASLWDKVDGTGSDQSSYPAKYGTITSLAVVNAAGSADFTYIPPADVTANTLFYVVLETSSHELLLDGNNIYVPRPLGRIVILNSRLFEGALVADGSPLPGATVHLLYPEAYAETTRTDVAGRWSFQLPDAGRFLFHAFKAGYVPRTFASTEVLNAKDKTSVELESGAAGAYVSGTVTITSGGIPLALTQTVTVALLGPGEEEGEQISMGEVKTGDGQFRIDMAEDPEAPGYTLVAYCTDFRGSILLQGALPVTGVVVNMRPLTFSQYHWLVPTASGFRKNLIAGDGTRAGVAELPAGTVQMSQLTMPQNDSMTVELAVVTRTVAAETTDASPYLVAAKIYETNSPNTDYNYLSDYVYITIPFDLITVGLEGIEKVNRYIRHARDQSYLEYNLSVNIVPDGDILATDYIGTGKIGYATVRVSSLSMFGVGAINPSAGETPDMPFSGFKQYDPFDPPGCLLETAREGRGRAQSVALAGALAMAALALIAGALRRRRKGK